MEDIQQLQQRYEQLYGAPTLLFRAPGRINLIGEHTDYNHGLVLPAAIDRSLFFALGPNPTANEVQMHSANFDQAASFELSNLTVQPSGWLRYIQAVCYELMARDYPVQGFRCVFGGNIPIGSGLSSSAALTCGLISGLARLHAWEIARTEVALIAQAAEHRVGILCGLMDQYAVLFGQEDQVIQLDCRDLKVDYFPFELGGHCLLLLNSKVEHELASTAYNDRRASCERVLQFLQDQNPAIETLRDVTISMLDGMGDHLAADIARVRFVLAENERVRQTTQALQGGDLVQVGQLLYASHEGLSKVYEVSCPELDLLVDLSRSKTGIRGARMMGGGFGGCTINLTRKSEVTALSQDILAEYEKRTGIKGEAYVVHPAGGISEVIYQAS